MVYKKRMSEKILSLHKKIVLETDPKKMTIFLLILVLIQITSGLTEELTEELTEGKDQNRLSKGKYHTFLLRSIL